VRVSAYTKDDLRELPYPVRQTQIRWATMRGAADLALLQFFRDHSTYDRYWVIEFDVRYTSPWHEFFDEMESSDADLLCTQIARHVPNDAWVHWNSLESCQEASPEQMVKGFLAICRLSHGAMSAIDAACQRGWSGHYEASWPTVVSISRQKLEDIGGNSRFTPEIRQNKYYSFSELEGVGRIGNFAAWPLYSDKSDFIHRTKGLLWHPVKD
jgi:hypothetical protein